MGTKKAWSPERRARQRAIIQTTKPWLHSTGPRTVDGKSKSSGNAKLSEELTDARNRLDQMRSAALDLFGRTRWPRWPN